MSASDPATIHTHCLPTQIAYTLGVSSRRWKARLFLGVCTGREQNQEWGVATFEFRVRKILCGSFLMAKEMSRK